MDYFTMCSKVLQELYNDSVDTFSDLTAPEHLKIKDLLNYVNSEVVLGQQLNWIFRERSTDLSVIADQQTYTLPNGMIIDIDTNNTSFPLEYENDWRYLTTDQSGDPDVYWIYNNILYLYPIPFENDTYTIRYLTHYPAQTAGGVDKSEMTLTDDTSIIPERHQRILIYGACRDFYRRVDKSQYNYYASKFQKVFIDMKYDLRKEVLDSPRLRMSSDRRTNTDIISDFFDPRW